MLRLVLLLRSEEDGRRGNASAGVKDALGGPVSPVLNAADRRLSLTSHCSRGLRFGGHRPLAMRHGVATKHPVGSGSVPVVAARLCPFRGGSKRSDPQHLRHVQLFLSPTVSRRPVCPPAWWIWHCPHPGARALWQARQQERHEATQSILPAARLPSALMPKYPNKPALRGMSGTEWKSVPPVPACRHALPCRNRRSPLIIPQYRWVLARLCPSCGRAALCCANPGGFLRSFSSTFKCRRLLSMLMAAGSQGRSSAPSSSSLPPPPARGSRGVGGFPDHPLLGWSREAHPTVGSFLQLFFFFFFSLQLIKS